MCFCSVPVPFFSDMFFSFFYFRAVSEQRMKPYIKLRTTMTSWMWTLVSFKRKLKCNATLYECVLAHFLLYYFYIVFSSFLVPISSNFFPFFSFSLRKIHLWLSNIAIRAMSPSIKCQTNMNKRNVYDKKFSTVVEESEQNIYKNLFIAGIAFEKHYSHLNEQIWVHRVSRGYFSCVSLTFFAFNFV